jgi:UDP:flavonoid glycosyltransferase YjiC (YdhE family)
VYADQLVGKEINSFRTSLDLPSARRQVQKLFLSNQLAIGLFPPWFAERQPDWPDQLHTLGFPMADPVPDGGLPPEVNAFLELGEAPVVVTLGTGMMHAKLFFEVAAKACVKINQRAILLTPHKEQIPRELPDTIRHFDYVSLANLLPKSRMMIHHGGIGTAARALQAGIPQLIMPVAYEQPDTAMRLKRLGVARSLRPSRFRTELVAKCLEELIYSAKVREDCNIIRVRMAATLGNAMENACALIESLMKTVALPS